MFEMRIKKQRWHNQPVQRTGRGAATLRARHLASR